MFLLTRKKTKLPFPGRPGLCPPLSPAETQADSPRFWEEPHSTRGPKEARVLRSEPSQRTKQPSLRQPGQQGQHGGTGGSGRGSRRGAHRLPLSQLPPLLPVLILELDLDLLSLPASPAEAGGARPAATMEKLVAGGLGGPWRWGNGGGRSGQSCLGHHTVG